MRSKEVLLDNISHNIKTIRKFLENTQEEFSEELGIKRSTLGAYEDRRAFPPIDILLILADISTYHLDDFCLGKLKIITRMNNNGFHEELELNYER